jgi:hypothetical protein
MQLACRTRRRSEPRIAGTPRSYALVRRELWARDFHRTERECARSATSTARRTKRRMISLCNTDCAGLSRHAQSVLSHGESVHRADSSLLTPAMRPAACLQRQCAGCVAQVDRGQSANPRWRPAAQCGQARRAFDGTRCFGCSGIVSRQPELHARPPTLFG